MSDVKVTLVLTDKDAKMAADAIRELHDMQFDYDRRDFETDEGLAEHVQYLEALKRVAASIEKAILANAVQNTPLAREGRRLDALAHVEKLADEYYDALELLSRTDKSEPDYAEYARFVEVNKQEFTRARAEYEQLFGVKYER